MSTSDALRLRPGLPVLRRDAGHLQVGVDPPICVVLPDSQEVRRLLDQLAEGATAPPPGPRARRAWELLLAAELLVDGATADAEPALAMAHGPAAAARRRARAALPVLLDVPAALALPVRRALSKAGLAVVEDADSAAVTLVADAGVVRRERVDELIRADRTHLVVHGGPQHWTVGPFVVPGSTACLRCLDAEASERDPRRAFVLEQGHRVRMPVDPLLRDLALGWAVHDLVRYAEGERPTTWSTTVSVGLGFPEQRTWRRHPHCGCGWDLVLSDPAS
ncbi:hypothetical protein [Nocardioides insulae]|uniref:hypothetical protein n=1 Tax=Nocardioides insulae TaxID=394734 RepID=UPI00040BB6BB|nr:hypothetical protein [Nocardioides insulae]